jgi:AcrR family transcriptional regulator
MPSSLQSTECADVCTIGRRRADGGLVCRGVTGPAHETNAAGAAPPRRSRTGTLAERQQRRREAMLAAGLDLFGTKGYTATRVDEVCRQASVSTRNFYEEFDNRLDLLVAVGDRVAATVFTAWTTASGPGLRARVSALVHALVDDPRVARVAFVEVWQIDPAAGRTRHETVRIFPEWIAAYMQDEFDRRGLSTRERTALTVATFGAADELIADWVLSPDGDRPPVDTLIDEVAAVTATILGRPTGGREAQAATPRPPGPARPG